RVTTKGVKEEELVDLKKAIQEAVSRYHIEGVVTGAVRSRYQADRIQRICDELGLKCVNPLWMMNQVELLREVVKKGIRAVITGVFAEPFDESFLGKEIDDRMIVELSKQQNPAGEGGEIETTVVDAPVFKKRIKITKSSVSFEKFSGVFRIEDAVLESKV
ncbi:diphthine--ammonia ligase, partial [Candidatus Woesearchaeota archaeon]|nr:diphthine--ammonia ligase [Candidatus Woesearchaeota archaeon]